MTVRHAETTHSAPNYWNNVADSYGSYCRSQETRAGTWASNSLEPVERHPLWRFVSDAQNLLAEAYLASNLYSKENSGRIGIVLKIPFTHRGIYMNVFLVRHF